VRALECGPADGPPVFLVHGWSCSVYVYRKSYRALADAGFRVMAADLKGHGLSAKPLAPCEYTRDAMAAHVLDIMDAFGVSQAALVGHSMGGAIATQVALRAPERVSRLVLLAPVGFGEVNLLRLLKLVTPRAVTPLLPHLVFRWTVTLGLRLAYGGIGGFDRRDVDEYWAPTQFPEFVRAMRELAHAFSWDAVTEDDLGQLLTPTLILFGTADRFVRPGRAEELARAMPNGRCEMIERGGHIIIEEAASRVNDAVANFLREPAPAAMGPVQRLP